MHAPLYKHDSMSQPGKVYLMRPPLYKHDSMSEPPGFKKFKSNLLTPKLDLKIVLNKR